MSVSIEDIKNKRVAIIDGYAQEENRHGINF